MATIRELMSRRTDLSTFVVHLTREFGDNEPDDNLESILRDRQIEARSCFGSAVKPLRAMGAEQNASRDGGI
jgi:hypothetical protein